MSLRRKTLLVVSFTLVGLMSLLYIVSREIYLHSFATLENKHLCSDVERVVSTLRDDLTNLGRIAGDYAAWDNTYAFMENRDSEYMDSEFTAESLSRLNTSFVFFLDNAGQYVGGKMVDVESGQETTIPASILRQVTADKNRGRQSSSTISQSEIVLLPEGPTLLVGQPVLTSDFNGPPRGMMYLGRFLDQTAVDDLSHRTLLDVEIHPYDENQLTLYYRNAQTVMQNGIGIAVKADSDNAISGMTVLRDRRNHPSIMLRVSATRDIYRQGQSSVHYLILATLLVGLVFGTLTLVWIEKLVLYRVTKLNRDVNQIGIDGDLAARVDAAGHDELGKLAEAINSMLTAIEKSENDLLAVHDKLESRVRERTAELDRANAELQMENAERKKAEEKARLAHIKTEQLLSSMSSILVGVDMDGVIHEWNEAAEKATGIPSSSTLGKKFHRCGVQWDWHRILDAVADCHTKQAPVRVDDILFKRPDGREGYAGITINPVRDSAGSHVGYLVVGADITRRRMMQQQLAQAQKLESVGQLAAGIAHEINTPTQFVGDNTQFLQDAFGGIKTLIHHFLEMLNAARNGPVSGEQIAKIEEALQQSEWDYYSEEIPKAIRESLDGVARVSAIVKAMKEFSHPGGTEKEMVDLNTSIESTITVARNEWKYVADMETNLDPNLPHVPCLQGDFNQVILNLIVNASHAIADAARSTDGGKGLIRVSTKHCGDWVEIRVQDSGTGIPEDIRSRVFDPFFTTKEVGKGTGQGLAIAHAVIAEKHGGTITFESEVGKGTTFIIRMPILPPQADKSQSKSLQTVAV